MYKLRNRMKELMQRKYGDKSNWPTQAQLAEATNLSQTTISRWLADKVDRFDSNVVSALCVHFGCKDISELLFLDEIQER